MRRLLLVLLVVAGCSSNDVDEPALGPACSAGAAAYADWSAELDRLPSGPLEQWQALDAARPLHDPEIRMGSVAARASATARSAGDVAAAMTVVRHAVERGNLPPDPGLTRAVRDAEQVRLRTCSDGR